MTEQAILTHLAQAYGAWVLLLGGMGWVALRAAGSR